MALLGDRADAERYYLAGVFDDVLVMMCFDRIAALELDSSDFALMFDYANFLDEVIDIDIDVVDVFSLIADHSGSDLRRRRRTI